MRRRFFFAILCAFAAGMSGAAADDSMDAGERARREAWGFAVLVASILERGENNVYPGIRAWLADFRQVEARIPAADASAPFPALDATALVTRNPRFWSACYEIAPGDAGFALLHASLLLCGGEAQRATAIATIGLQREAAPAEFRRALAAVITGAQAAQAASHALVQEGVALHDAGRFAGALGRFDAALEAWPANGSAYFERGTTLRVQALADAAQTRRVSLDESDGDDEPVADPPGIRMAFARARQHDPFCVMAYQDEDPAALEGMMALVRTALPIWESLRKRPPATATREELRDLSESCRTAAIYEYALAARQQFVARNRRYAPEDLAFIEACVHQLAPDADVTTTLALMGSDARLARQTAAPETPEIAEEMGDASVGSEAFVVAQIASAEARLEKEAMAAAAAKSKAAAKAKASSKSKSKAKKRKRS